mmetsp:Transcript_27750/g.33911  ORF Transcript_27750/g.33911 Transcript_27750/m.33911 type:complete len:232 (+) Transcript_27750:70-765(+)
MKFTAAAQLITIGATIAGSVSAENLRKDRRSLYMNSGNSMANFRVGKQYTTWSSDEHLTKVGSTFEISPTDSYDFVPAKGYGDAKSVVAQLQVGKEEKGEAFVAELFGFFYSSEEATKWAKSTLRTEMIHKDQVPMPNESLIAKELTVDAVEELSLSEEKVLCHETELESYFCHKLGGDKTLNISKVTVSPAHGKPSTLFVACHYFGDVGCHVMNVNDFIVSTSEEKIDFK